MQGLSWAMSGRKRRWAREWAYGFFLGNHEDAMCACMHAIFLHHLFLIFFACLMHFTCSDELDWRGLEDLALIATECYYHYRSVR